MSSFNSAAGNPLQKYYRQPKIYISLPSNGKFYQNGALELSETGEYPVYSMTAKDELSFKTPDALLNGQSTVDVVQSCVPNIKNAWGMPSLDLDAVLIAIRMATFGHNMDLNVKIPNTKEERSYGLDLRLLLDSFTGKTFDDALEYQDLKIKIRPLSYKEFTENALKTFEEQKIFKMLNNDAITDSQKMSAFQKSFAKLNDLNFNMILSSIVSIEVDGETITKREYIEDFLNNSDKDFFKAVSTHIQKQKENFAIKPLEIETLEEDQEKGAPKKFTVPITFDQANFFA